MGIILKHTFKNIFKKPGRTFLLTLCIFLCSLAASLCLDMTGSVRRMFVSFFSDMIGSTDVMLVNGSVIDESMFEGMPENRHLLISSSTTPFYQRDNRTYSFVAEIDATVYGVDLKKANEMDILLTELELNDHETAFTKDLGELLDLKEGDTVEFYDRMGDKQEFVIKQFIDKGGLLANDKSCIISNEGMLRLSNGYNICFEAMIDFIDDKDIDTAVEKMKEQYPQADITNVRSNSDIDDAVSMISNLFYTLFAVCLLVVIIITVTVSERIISERMSVIGTLRSLGVSQSMTVFILMLENIIYALMGSIPALLVYSAIREPFLSIFFLTSGDSLSFGSMSLYVAPAVILGAVILESACTIKESIKASRTSIRDIIFLNKDTEYRYSKAGTAVGIILLVVGLITLFISGNAAVSITCFISLVISVYLIFPYVSIACSKLFEKLFDRMGMPVARLAAAEAHAKKSTIASACLIAAVSGICVLLFIISDSLYKSFELRTYEGDIIVHGLTEEDYMYDYIDDLEGVVSTENEYSDLSTDISVNGHEIKRVSIIGYDTGELFVGARGINAPVKDNEFYMDKPIADASGISVGDTVEVILNSTSFIPYNITLTFAGYTDTSSYDTSCKAIVISKANYIASSSDHPMNLLIKTDGVHDEEIIAAIRRYSAATMDTIIPLSEYYVDQDSENHSEMMMIKMMGLIGLVLTFVGVVSNQLIGFESRRRENAVLLSTAMTKADLRKMLLLETLTASVPPVILAIPFGILLSLPIKAVMYSLELSMPIVINWSEHIALCFGLMIVFAMSVLFPYRMLRKIRLSEQLKYE